MEADKIEAEQGVGGRQSWGRYSGQFVVRVPRSLHRRLAEMAGRERVPMNVLVVLALDEFVSRGMEGIALPEEPVEESPGLLGALGRVLGGGRKRAAESPAATAQSGKTAQAGEGHDSPPGDGAAPADATAAGEFQSEVAAPETAARRERPMRKYDPLGEHLNNVSASVRTESLTFSRIEEIIGAKLPPAARKHRPWWANNAGTHVQAKAWLEAEWEVDSVNMVEETVVFRRMP